MEIRVVKVMDKEYDGPPEKRPWELHKIIEYLRKRKVISERVAGLIHMVRVIGNVATHQLDPSLGDLDLEIGRMACCAVSNWYETYMKKQEGRRFV